MMEGNLVGWEFQMEDMKEMLEKCKMELAYAEEMYLKRFFVVSQLYNFYKKTYLIQPNLK